MGKNKSKLRGYLHAKRVHDVERIYEEHCRSGLSNREIWRRYIYPIHPMCERTFYNLINASCDQRVVKRIDELQEVGRQLSLF